MTISPQNPLILIVTPEVSFLPRGMCKAASELKARAGELADISASLINALFKQGANIHVALPDYRNVFNHRSDPVISKEMELLRGRMPFERIHLAQDRAFFYLDRIYSDNAYENMKVALAFQRDIINNIIPEVRPDLIHCHDWMTSLIPAMARQLKIPCLFTVHDLYTLSTLLSHIEDIGIDCASFWQHCFFERRPFSYEETRNSNPMDFLGTGIFAAHFVSTVSSTFLTEVVNGKHEFVPTGIKEELSNKLDAGCAVSINSAPDPSYNPAVDKSLYRQFGPENHFPAKQYNKLFLQKSLGLALDSSAPVFFWPSRLDGLRRGCHLLAEILCEILSRYQAKNLQVVFIGDGEFQGQLKEIVTTHHLEKRVGISNFNDRLSRLAYAGSDFILKPSLFEPCGVSQMIGPIYGSLPVARDTGGIHDTIDHMDMEKNTGNGFLFKTFDANGLLWGIEQAMHFYTLPEDVKAQQIKRIMKQSPETFNHEIAASRYIKLYEEMLQRPLISHT